MSLSRVSQPLIIYKQILSCSHGVSGHNQEMDDASAKLVSNYFADVFIF